MKFRYLFCEQVEYEKAHCFWLYIRDEMTDCERIRASIRTIASSQDLVMPFLLTPLAMLRETIHAQ